MKLVALFILLLCTQAILPISPPQISSSFSSNVRVIVSDSEGEHSGVGFWGVNQTGGMALENYVFDNDEYDIFNLQRYDIGMQYSLDPTDTSKCMSFHVNGTLPQVWDWVILTSFMATSVYNNQSVDIWEAKLGYAYIQIAVSSNDTTTPVYVFRGNRGERNTTYEFLNWESEAPDAKFFAVPSACNSSTPAFTDEITKKPAKLGCIQRSEIIARAKVWVDHHVPYNQGGTYEGYREDCSGYVSMCWASSEPGHTTYTMHEIAHQISKDELQPGDCLLYAAEHVVLFGGWLNSEKTQYQAYEETRPGEGTVTRPTPYPYWYSQSDFIPFRYDSVC